MTVFYISKYPSPLPSYYGSSPHTTGHLTD
ncbi:hypothetical protein F903_00311 [Acinetobacter sp. NIPH 298]|nr:hypothetical protein F903_00311 [Acinetobacter sp. NIPH 298]